MRDEAAPRHTDTERMAWLEENPVQSSWYLFLEKKRWTVYWFGGMAHGGSFAEAVDKAMNIEAGRMQSSIGPRSYRVPAH